MWPQRAVPDAFPSTSTLLIVALVSQLWTAVSGKVIATQMSARVVETQYGKMTTDH